MHAAHRNILFNTATFKRILPTAQQMDSSGEAGESRGNELLYQLGYAASSRFAQHFQQHMEAKDFTFDLTNWLKEWTKYDSNAGFGHMEVRELAKDHHEAQVVISYSFLTHGDDRGGPRSLCRFMVGYIEGLLKNFANALYDKYGLNRKEIRVIHDLEIDCYHGHQDPEKGCIFLVQVPRTTTSIREPSESHHD